MNYGKENYLGLQRINFKRHYIQQLLEAKHFYKWHRLSKMTDDQGRIQEKF